MKRFISFILVILVTFAFMLFASCDKVEENLPASNQARCAIHFLNVGEGDAILIKLPDGKVMLIDCGESSEVNKKCLENNIDLLGGKIDYFILSHPDADHVGNAKYIVDKFKINTAYLPYLVNPSRFNIYNEFYQTINSKNTDIIYSSNIVNVETDDYYFAFLTPKPHEMSDSAYNDLNLSETPPNDKVNAVSPIIYFECDGVRFLFTGDAPSKVEVEAIDYAKTVLAEKVNLKNLDFLKVSHHGSSDASCDEFLEEICPKNAIISVGKNSYGHPSRAVIDRLISYNQNVSIWHTDVQGSVSVLIDGGKYRVQTAL